MKKILKIFVFIIFIIQVYFINTNVYANTENGLKGNGTIENPYQITNESELYLINEQLDKCYILMNDIEIDDNCLFPISYKEANAFTGNFDGNGHIIKGIKEKNFKNDFDVNNGTRYRGIFGYNKGIIKNLGVISEDIKIQSGTYCIGGIAGCNEGTIESAYYCGSITLTNSVSSAKLGGIAGETKRGGKIINSYNSANLKGGGTGIILVSGITNNNGSCIVKNCYNVGNLYNSENYNINNANSISEKYATIENCYAISDNWINDENINEVKKVSLKEMKNQETFNGWDFNNVWKMGNGKYNLPILKNVKMDELKENTTEFASGDGIVNPYVIRNEEQLLNVKNHDMSRFILNNDIIFSDNDYKENGKYYNNGNFLENLGFFYGVFDGNGYSVSNYKMSYKYDNNSNSNFGFFSMNCGSILNLNIQDCTLKYEHLYSSAGNSGIITGYNTGKIDNCSSSGKIEVYYSIGSPPIGGIVGENRGIIINSKNKANIYGLNNNKDADSPYSPNSNYCIVGGICGKNYKIIKNCYNEGNVESNAYNAYAGGLVGKNEANAYVQKSYNSGEIYAYGHFPKSGGICGHNCGDLEKVANIGIVSASENWNDKIGMSYIGGIAGWNDNIISKANNAGKIIDSNIGYIKDVGGICGHNRKTIENVYNSSNISISCGYVGGIIGDNYESGKLQYAYNVGLITSKNDILDYSNNIVSNNNGNIQYCYYLYDEKNIIDGAEKLSLTQMKTQSNYLGFDFQNVWEMENGEYKLPILKDVENNSKIVNINGDINGDGKVNITDVALINSHVKKVNILAGDELIRADVNGDGKVNITDVGLVNSHVKKVKLLW